MDYQPILPPVGTKFGNNRWEVYSPKIGRLVHLYSDLEYYHWLKVEVDSKIIDFCEQPLKIWPNTPHEKAISYSIPDMITLDINHNFTLIEVKHSQQLADPRVKRQIKIQRSWAAQHHMGHEVFTDKILDKRFYLSAWKQIIQTVASTDKSSVEHECQTILQLPHNTKLTINKILRQTAGDSNKVLIATFHLIYAGQVSLDNLSGQLSMNTEVTIYD